MAHTHQIRIYYSHTDAGGIVYHARYLDFAEHARTELLRLISNNQEHQKKIMQATEVGFVVTAISVDYHSPAFLDDVLSVITTVEQLKRFSMTFLQKIERDGQKIATLKVKVASISQKSLKPIPLESWFTEAVNAL